jgi:hypothetical protein
MNARRTPKPRRHEHVERRVHLLVQRAGVPYEVERTVCERCRLVLSERRLGRASA